MWRAAIVSLVDRVLRRAFGRGRRGALGRALGALLAAQIAACSAPATLSELRTAEHRADAGDVEGALAAYHEAQARCGALRPARRARAACSEALLGEAEVLEHAGRTRPAIEVYLAIPPRAAGDPATAATAVYRAGELLLGDHQVGPAWTALWRVVTDYPDEPIASDALRTLLTDGRGRDPRALADEMARLLTALAETEVADNLLWSLADLSEHELGNLPAARAYYDRIPADTPASGLRDDARWHAARISRLLHDPAGAAARLRALLATREVAFGAGSYFSIWLDDAQLELGKVLRDDLGDLPGAAAAFRRLPEDYPASILRDDALYELAVTLERMHDHAGACSALHQLARQFADSKYLERGAELGCP
ncbi:MAG TPA: tetratricopeptide repeat protein [Kofleriaceae bacterium]|nr:tetratricopeptide repeat protein [Kofleriaceae bacterium]